MRIEKIQKTTDLITTKTLDLRIWKSSNLKEAEKEFLKFINLAQKGRNWDMRTWD